jgi:iron complex outermembrane receptor protein
MRIFTRVGFLLATMSVAGFGSRWVEAETAADTPDSQLEEITVTAQKRNENQQTTPIAVSVFSSRYLAETQTTDMSDLAAQVPSFNFGTYAGTARLAIRGLGYDAIDNASEGRVAYNIDGVYISRPADVLGTFFDVGQIEVLRGPQGTLYGRNAVAGSVNVATNDPTDVTSGNAQLTVGNYALRTFDGAIGGPITDTLSYRLALQTNDRNGYGENVVTGHGIDDAHTQSARLKLRYKPSDELSFLLSVDYHQEHDSDYATHYAGGANPMLTPVAALAQYGSFVPADERDIAAATDPRNDREFYGAALRADWKLSDFSLRSITAYRHSQFTYSDDVANSSNNLAPLSTEEISHQASQEFQIYNDSDTSHWIAGLYYFREIIPVADISIPSNSQFIGAPYPGQLLEGYFAGGSLATTAAAAFGQYTRILTPALSLTLGGRYSWERKAVDELAQYDVTRLYNPANPIEPFATQQSSSSESAFTPKAGIEYRFNDQTFAYGTISEGFKSGGYNVGGVQPPFAPEKLWDYEVGVKNSWLDNRFRANVAAFYYQYRDLQTTIVIGNSVVIQNAASASLYGAELELRGVLTSAIESDFTLGLLHSRFDQYSTSDPARPYLGTLNLSGNQLSQSPKATAALGINYKVPREEGTYTFRVEGTYQARVFFTPFNTDALSQGGYGLLNAFLNFDVRSSGVTIGLWGRNLANRTVWSSMTVASATFNDNINGYLLPPRTWGLTIGYKF